MKSGFFSLILILSGVNQACTTVESISISQIPSSAKRKAMLTSSASNPVILLIPFGNSFVEEAHQDLIGQCSDGRLEGMLAKHQNTNYFMGLFMKQEVIMQAYCLKAVKKG